MSGKGSKDGAKNTHLNSNFLPTLHLKAQLRSRFPTQTLDLVMHPRLLGVILMDDDPYALEETFEVRPLTVVESRDVVHISDVEIGLYYLGKLAGSDEGHGGDVNVENL